MGINPVLQTGLLNQSSAQVIDGSLKFQRANGNYLTRTITSEVNRKTWTYSCWIKRKKRSADLDNYGDKYRLLTIVLLVNGRDEPRLSDMILRKS